MKLNLKKSVTRLILTKCHKMWTQVALVWMICPQVVLAFSPESSETKIHRDSWINWLQHFWIELSKHRRDTYKLLYIIFNESSLPSESLYCILSLEMSYMESQLNRKLLPEWGIRTRKDGYLIWVYNITVYMHIFLHQVAIRTYHPKIHHFGILFWA